MANDIPQTSHHESVLFADSGYIGLFRRLIIVAVDGAVIMSAWWFLGWLWYNVIDPIGEPYRQLVGSWLAFGYVYLAILKPSRLRTAGLWLTGARIVNHEGKRPSIVRMTFRVLLLALGPLHPILDVFWLGGDRHRQTLRDKFAGTYVVKVRALPIGPGRRKAAYYSVFGATFIFWEIHECAPHSSPASQYK